VVEFFTILPNGLPLAAVGGFGALHCQPRTNIDRSTALDLTTSAPIAANGCYVALFSSIGIIKSSVSSTTTVSILLPIE